MVYNRNRSGKSTFWAEAGSGVGFVPFAAGCCLPVWGCSDFPRVPKMTRLTPAQAAALRAVRKDLFLAVDTLEKLGPRVSALCDHEAVVVGCWPCRLDAMLAAAFKVAADAPAAFDRALEQGPPAEGV